MTLKNVNLNTSATFRCEVSADEPDFQTVMRQANLTVIRKFPLHLLLLLLLYLSQRGGGGGRGGKSECSDFLRLLYSLAAFQSHENDQVALPCSPFHCCYDDVGSRSAHTRHSLPGLCVSACVHEVCASPLSGEGGGRVRIHYTFFFFFFFLQKGWRKEGEANSYSNLSCCAVYRFRGRMSAQLRVECQCTVE